MSTLLRKEQRESTMQRRRKPGNGRCLQFAFDADCSLESLRSPEGGCSEAPAEIHLEATNKQGETAAWLDDYFWMDLIQRWSDAPISIHLQPTPQVMQHEIINHQLNMLRRVVPHWRLIGQCYVSDLEDQGVLQQTAVAVYHEVHILDGRRTDAPTSKPSLGVEEAIASMRDIQRANKRSTPIFVGVQVREERSSAEQSVRAKHTISAGAAPSVANSMA